MLDLTSISQKRKRRSIALMICTYQMKHVEIIYLHCYRIAWHPLCLSHDVFLMLMIENLTNKKHYVRINRKITANLMCPIYLISPPFITDLEGFGCSTPIASPCWLHAGSNGPSAYHERTSGGQVVSNRQGRPEVIFHTQSVVSSEVRFSQTSMKEKKANNQTAKLQIFFLPSHLPTANFKLQTIWSSWHLPHCGIPIWSVADCLQLF